MKVLILLGLGLFLSNLQAQTFHTDIRGTNDAIDGGMFQLATPSANHYLRLFSGRVGDPKPFLYFNGADTFRIASGISDFSNFTENMTILNGFGSDGSNTTFVGIANRQPKAELDLKTNSIDDGSEIRIGNGDDSHFLRFFSGRQNFAFPSIYWKQGDSLSMGTDQNTYSEIFKLRSDGTMFLNSNKGIALDLGDRPLITRGWDKFTSGSYAGIGRWGVFMEPSYLTFGVPFLPDRGFQFVAYNPDGTIAVNLMRLKEDKLGLGNPDPQYLLDVNGDINFTSTLRVNGDPGLAGQVMTSNGTNDPSWTTPGPSNPQVGFKAHLTSDVAVSTLTEVTLASFTENYDDGGNFNHTTGVFTAPSDGVYHFECMISWTIGGVTQTDIPVMIRIKRNSTVEEQFAQRVTIFTLIKEDQHYSTDIKLVNGDQISFIAYQIGGSSMFISGSGGIEDTKVSGRRVY